MKLDPNLYRSYIWQMQYKVRPRQWVFKFIFLLFAQEKVTCKKHHAFPKEVTHLGVLC